MGQGTFLVMGQDRSRLANQEALAAQQVFALLLSEGHNVTDVRRPPLGEGRSPDFVFRLDGSLVALEVVRYLDRAAAQKALSRVLLVERALKVRLAPDAVAARGSIVVNLRYSVEALQSHKRADVDRDADQLTVDARAALGTARADLRDLCDFPTSVPWVADAQLSVVPGLEPNVYFGIAPGLPDGAPDPDGFIDQMVTAKADQHVGHASRAILAVLGMFRDDAEDLADAFSRGPGPIPWWRVYFVRDGATLAYEGPASFDTWYP